MTRYITIPPQVAQLLNRLNAAGFAAYAVGGCVRDSLLGNVPKDWDICTSAAPEETAACFSDLRTVLTGAKYGTVTVLFDGDAYEITTFRAESGYSDSRHPDAVRFLPSPEGDLARRDLTVNAMAADVRGAVTDLFGGLDDLQNGVIRCVGRAEARFSEDALRILRALRFASTLGFSVENETAAAIHALRGRLTAVAPERLHKELCGLLCGTHAAAVAREFSDVLCVLIPELAPCVGFRQYNPHHTLDVWEHTLAALDAVEPEENLRLAALLHDVGKPAAFTPDKQLVGHFYGHAIIGAALTERILRRLRFDGETLRTITELVRAHDCLYQPLGERRIRRLLSRYGEPMLRMLIRLQRADRLGKCAEPHEPIERDTREAERLLEAVLARDDCFSLAQLALSGNDLLALGIPQGRQIGRLLNALLDAVLSGEVKNERSELVKYAQKLREISENN